MPQNNFVSSIHVGLTLIKTIQKLRQSIKNLSTFTKGKQQSKQEDQGVITYILYIACIAHANKLKEKFYGGSELRLQLKSETTL